ncbi:hypothetical protein EDC04DRAFT_3093297 [Pisolithus marmoratus]|nr:hypothetical protein EDC04DRAFT_3093297 [Pisolithus marmoratus]
MDALAAMHSMCWVVISGDSPGIYSTCPTLHCGYSSPPLPIAIQCLLSTEAKMVNDCLQPILQQAPHNLHASELLTILSQSDIVHNLFSGQTGNFFPVIIGQPMGIHHTKELALSSLKGFAYPCWQEVPTFWDALVFMIAKGIEELLLDAPNHKGGACTVPTMLPETSLTSEDSLSPALPVTSTPTVNNPTSSATGSYKVSETRTKLRYHTGVIQSPTPTLVVAPSPIIYTHVCTLCGVIESQFYVSNWVPPPKAAADVLGIHRVKYLEAHSYVQSTVADIVEAYCTSYTDQDFTLSLTQSSLPLAEGFFMWYLFNL